MLQLDTQLNKLIIISTYPIPNILHQTFIVYVYTV